MKPPASARCAHCGAEIAPAATVCGFCQKPVGLTWLLRPFLTGLGLGLLLAVLAAGTIWVRASLRWAPTPEHAETGAAPAQPAASQDPAYAALLAQAEREVARHDYRLAAALLMQALALRPERPEARARLELLRAQLILEHPALAAPPGQAPDAPAWVPSPEPAGLVSIPGGPFLMGAGEPGGNADEYPAHEVLLSSYSIEAREVTVEAYRGFCAETRRKFPPQPSWSTPRHPVVSVTWHEAQAYCRHEGRRLPTEAEWDRAARCASPWRYPYGRPQSREPSDQAHPVGTNPPGRCGLFDSYGNVWEWVSDWYSATYYDNSPKRDPHGPRSGEEKVLRGGAFDSPPEALAATFRDKFSPDYGAENRGFRCAASRAP